MNRTINGEYLIFISSFIYTSKVVKKPLKAKISPTPISL